MERETEMVFGRGMTAAVGRMEHAMKFLENHPVCSCGADAHIYGGGRAMCRSCSDVNGREHRSAGPIGTVAAAAGPLARLAAAKLRLVEIEFDDGS
jgi:hypothetical protein